jgi:hypothetical protein
MVHDELIYFLATGTGCVTFLPDTLALYRQHGGNVAGATEGDAGVLARIRRNSDTAASNPHSVLERHAALAAAWAAALDGLAINIRGVTHREALEAGALLYRRISERQTRRARIYENRPRKARLLTVAGLVSDRAYGSRAHGGFGLRSLLKDVVFAAGRRAWNATPLQ